MCAHMYLYVCVRVCTSMCVCVHARLLFVCVYMCACVFALYVFVCVCVCMHVGMYVCAHVHL